MSSLMVNGLSVAELGSRLSSRMFVLVLMFRGCASYTAVQPTSLCVTNDDERLPFVAILTGQLL